MVVFARLTVVTYSVAGVIPFKFQYDAWFQSKLITVHGVSELYIHIKFYQGLSTMSDSAVDYNHVRGWSLPRGLSHVRGWSFLRGLSQCYEPMLHLYHHKHKSTADRALVAHFFLSFFLCHEILLR